MSWVVIDVDRAPRHPLHKGRGTSIQLVNEAIGARHVDLHINELHPRAPIGNYHVHRTAENIYLILAGRARMIVEGREQLAGAGQVVFIPPGVRHATGNAGDTPLRLVEIYAPPGPDFHIVE
jgi:mannose-6-phosphate isomerase-like protein (cupin superfamily)